MKKQKVIEIFKAGHKEFRQMLNQLTPEKIKSIPILGEWSVKDVMAHLAAWNWKQVEGIDRILKNKPIWNKPGCKGFDTDEFNKQAVEKRRNKGVQTVTKEWEKSFNLLIKRLNRLEDKEWKHKCGGQFWPDGRSLTIQSLFHYEEKGLSDEGEHAKQIKKRLKL